ncbi:MAG: FAD:protein FMN transferase [Chloroflexi bacterium]|nr:FAD:protein FMN transferase [Chloroflexota bacterium]
MNAPAPAANPALVASDIFMDTLVSIEIVAPASSEEAGAAAARAFGWFREIEQRCTRFDPASELMRLCAEPGKAIPVSALLFSLLEFALALAAETGGAFDPTVGAAMAQRGFDRNYRTATGAATGGERIPARGVAQPPFPGAGQPARATYHDIVLDPAARTVTLLHPLTLDLGAVAKGFAIDLAAHELEPYDNFAINAGGDIYAAGTNAGGEPWRIGIRHPRCDGALIDAVTVSGMAVCTSGDYERRRPGSAGHHILDPRAGVTAGACISATVAAPTAMAADAFATAAFVLGPARGIALLERHGLEGLLISPAFERAQTAGFAGYRR